MAEFLQIFYFQSFYNIHHLYFGIKSCLLHQYCKTWNAYNSIIPFHSQLFPELITFLKHHIKCGQFYSKHTNEILFSNIFPTLWVQEEKFIIYMF